MNIQIESLSLNQNEIEYTWSNNGGDESEIEKMSRDDFAKLLCEHSDGNSIYQQDETGEDEIRAVNGNQISEDDFSDLFFSINPFIELELKHSPDYCKECLAKHIQSQNKN